MTGVGVGDDGTVGNWLGAIPTMDAVWRPIGNGVSARKARTRATPVNTSETFEIQRRTRLDETVRVPEATIHGRTYELSRMRAPTTISKLARRRDTESRAISSGGRDGGSCGVSTMPCVRPVICSSESVACTGAGIHCVVGGTGAETDRASPIVRPARASGDERNRSTSAATSAAEL